jgi:hypothetical protein
MALPNPPSLTATIPYTKFSTSVYLWLPTIATQGAPTLAEFNAGKNLTSELMAVSGFDTQVAEIQLLKAGTSFAGNLPGRETPNASTLTFALSTAGPTVDVRSVLTQNALGFVVICNEGIVTSGYCDIWPSRIGAVSVTQDLEKDAEAVVSFSIYRTPSRNVAIPTA